MLRLFFIALAVVLAFASAARADTIPARVKPNSWRVPCTGPSASWPNENVNPAPDNPDRACQTICQNRWNNNMNKATQDGVKASVGWYLPMPNQNWGLNAQSKFYGDCRCFTNGVEFTILPTEIFSGCTVPYTLIADHECDQGTAVPSYYPASCYFATGSTTQNPASVCLDKVGYSVFKMVVMNGTTSATKGCFEGCEYNPPMAPKMVATNGASYASGLFTGSGYACLPGTALLIDVPDDVAIAATYATESTQIQNKNILQQIRDKLEAGLTTSGGSGSGGNTGGDLTRTATATEALAAAVAASGASAAGVQAEGEQIINDGANVSKSGVLDSLPQETVDISTAFTGVTVTAFGGGSCPAPVDMFEWNGAQAKFSFDLICEYAAYLGLLVIAAASIKGFTIAVRD